MKITALTLGPISKTMGQAHRMREIWMSSFFFSSLMERVVKHIPNKNEIILPYEIERTDELKSLGIYPDRLIIQSGSGRKTEVETALNSAIESLAIDFKFNNSDQLKAYLSCHIVEFEETDIPANSNIIFFTNTILGSIELSNSYTAVDSDCFINMYEAFIKTEFYKNIFPKNFPSIQKLTTTGLETDEINFDEDDEDPSDFWKTIKLLNKENYKQHHKYIAVVNADGDNVGKVIGAIGNDISNLKKFSKALSTFSLEAGRLIKEYGGLPLYAGGDDLLFFAPISNKDDNIFRVIESLDKCFDKYITNEFISDPPPSMSYGLNISYYKFPMHEALNSAARLLFETAKKSKNKNCVALKIQKHSGQSLKTIIPKPFGNNFKALIHSGSDLLLKSIIYQIDKQKTIIEGCLTKETLPNFFENFYNEDIHKKDEGKAYLKMVERLLLENYSTEKDTKKAIETTYTQLRFFKFLNAKPNE